MTLPIGYLEEQACRYCGAVNRNKRVRFICRSCKQENQIARGDRVPAQTLTARQMNREARKTHLRVVPSDPRDMRPRTRGECAEGPRPCPWVSCRYHLAIEVTPSGGLKMKFPGVELEDMPQTCALDAADEGPKGLDIVGYLTNTTRERARQIEKQAFDSFKSALILTKDDA